MTNIETTKGNYHVRIYLKDVFSFAGDHICTYGLGYKLTLQRYIHHHVLSHLAGAKEAAIFALVGRGILGDIILCVQHFSPNIANQKFLLWHIVSIAAREVSYIKGLSYMEDVTTQKIGILINLYL